MKANNLNNSPKFIKSLLFFFVITSFFTSGIIASDQKQSPGHIFSATEIANNTDNQNDIQNFNNRRPFNGGEDKQKVKIIPDYIEINEKVIMEEKKDIDFQNLYKEKSSHISLIDKLWHILNSSHKKEYFIIKEIVEKQNEIKKISEQLEKLKTDSNKKLKGIDKKYTDSIDLLQLLAANQTHIKKFEDAEKSAKSKELNEIISKLDIVLTTSQDQSQLDNKNQAKIINKVKNIVKNYLNAKDILDNKSKNTQKKVDELTTEYTNMLAKQPLN